MRFRSFYAQPFRCARKLQSRSICRNRWPISFEMDGRCWRRRFLAAATGISLEWVPLRFWRKKELTTRACTGRSSMRAETPSWRTPTPTCQSHAEGNLFRRRCIISCGSPGRMECTPDICRAIRRPMAVFECPNSMQSRFSTRSASAHRSQCLEEHRLAVI